MSSALDSLASDSGLTRGGDGLVVRGELLARAFGGLAPVVAVDLPGIREWLTACGVPVVELADVMTITEGAVVAVNAKPESAGFARRPQPGVRKIYIVHSAQDADEHTVRYTIAQLLASDPLVCAQRQGDVAAAIRSLGGCISFTGSGTELTARSRGRVGLIHLDDPIVKPGESIACAPFFEIGIASPEADAIGAVLVNGHCRAAGMIASWDRILSAGSAREELAEYRREIARIGVDLYIHDSELEACLLGGRDIKDDIARWTGTDGLRLTECSIGTNAQVLSGVDWSVNSLMNEGAEGIHIGIGRPPAGIHFDFICPGVTFH